jgi:hypothetical protein
MGCKTEHPVLNFTFRGETFYPYLTNQVSRVCSASAGTEGFPPAIKQPENEADLSGPSNAEISYVWICISTNPYVFLV